MDCIVLGRFASRKVIFTIEMQQLQSIRTYDKLAVRHKSEHCMLQMNKIKKNRRQPVIDFYGKYKRYQIEGQVQVIVYYLQTAEKKKEYYCLLTKKSRCCRSCFSVQISHYPLFLKESFVAKLFSNKHSGHFTLSSRLLFLVKHCTQSNLTFC